MSDLHKAFLKRVKQKERALGLDLLSEEVNNEEEHGTAVNTDEDVKLSEELRHFKIDTFDKIEKYDSSGIFLQTYYKFPKSENAPIFIYHHGAGSSSMTFAKLAQMLALESDSGIFLLDARGHGESSDTDEFSLVSFTSDFKNVINEFVSRYQPQNTLYLVGHSLGGSVLANYLIENPDMEYNIKGLVMLDIVEETAVRSLSSMPTFVQKRPSLFNSINDAIDWHISRTSILHNRESASLSVTDLLKPTPSGSYRWITDLNATKPFWDSWFKGLSQNFIDSGKKQHIAKLLLLSAHESLDKTLTIGQMQGKYQLIVFNNITCAGHFLQEDIPNQVLMTLLEFAHRNDSPDDYIKKQLGFVPKWGGKIHS